MSDNFTDEATVPQGATVLADVDKFIRRFVVFPSEHCYTAVTLWAAHTHAPDAFYVTPRLILDSAEPGSGKSRVLEILNLLCSQTEMTISASVPAIFRMLHDAPMTILFDEVDAIFNPKASGNNEDLRALLNSGYKRGATVARCVGDAKVMKVQRFKVFAPVALAGLAGHMPRTITTRAVTIHMRHRAPGETVEPFRERDAEIDAKPIKVDLDLWVTSQAEALATARPTMPPRVTDRAAEVWEALLAVADAAGGDWPAKARKACEHFVLNTKPGELSLGVRLLRDMRNIVQPDAGNDRMASAELVAKLVALPEAPWGDLDYGKPLDQRRLAKELGRYAIESKPIKTPGREGTLRGYMVGGEDGLAQAWLRYLDFAETRETHETPQVRVVSDEISVSLVSETDSRSETALTRQVSPVAEVSPIFRFRGSGEIA